MPYCHAHETEFSRYEPCLGCAARQFAYIVRNKPKKDRPMKRQVMWRLLSGTDITIETMKETDSVIVEFESVERAANRLECCVILKKEEARQLIRELQTMIAELEIAR